MVTPRRRSAPRPCRLTGSLRPEGLRTSGPVARGPKRTFGRGTQCRRRGSSDRPEKGSTRDASSKVARLRMGEGSWRIGLPRGRASRIRRDGLVALLRGSRPPVAGPSADPHDPRHRLPGEHEHEDRQVEERHDEDAEQEDDDDPQVDVEERLPRPRLRAIRGRSLTAGPTARPRSRERRQMLPLSPLAPAVNGTIP